MRVMRVGAVVFALLVLASGVYAMELLDEGEMAATGAQIETENAVCLWLDCSWSFCAYTYTCTEWEGAIDDCWKYFPKDTDFSPLCNPQAGPTCVRLAAPMQCGEIWHGEYVEEACPSEACDTFLSDACDSMDCRTDW